MREYRSEFTVTVGDFRAAYYFVTAVRKKIFARVFVLMTVFELVHFVGSLTGLWPLNRTLAVVYVPFFIWALLLLAGAERQIKAYMKSEHSFLGCRYTAELTETQMRILVPEKNVDKTVRFSAVSCAFEISRMFLVYFSAQDLYILPKRALSEDAQALLREKLADKLPTLKRKK